MDFPIFGLIGECFDQTGVCATDVADYLRRLPKGQKPHVLINSDGGRISEGVAIAKLLASHTGGYTAEVVGQACSCASYIMAKADHVTIAGDGWVMIHDPRAGKFGNAATLRAEADTLDKMADQYARAYSQKSRLTEAEARAAMAAETWYTAEEALAAGLVDVVSSDEAIACVVTSELGFTNVPARVAVVSRSGVVTPREEPARMAQDIPTPPADDSTGDEATPTPAAEATASETPTETPAESTPTPETATTADNATAGSAVGDDAAPVAAANDVTAAAAALTARFAKTFGDRAGDYLAAGKSFDEALAADHARLAAANVELNKRLSGQVAAETEGLGEPGTDGNHVAVAGDTKKKPGAATIRMPGDKR